MSVPLHTRNDVHLFPIGKMEAYKVFWNYETYIKKNINSLNNYPVSDGDKPDQALFSNSYPDLSCPDISPVSSLFDSNQYDGSTPFHDTLLLDYFFRGEIDLVANEYDGYLIKNNTNEEMHGTFELYYDNLDGERIMIESDNLPFNTTIAGYGTSENIFFPVPTDAGESGRYILVFRGSLGNENDAVVG